MPQHLPHWLPPLRNRTYHWAPIFGVIAPPRNPLSITIICWISDWGILGSTSRGRAGEGIAESKWSWTSIDWFCWQNLQESPIFNGKIYGFRFRFSLWPIHWGQIWQSTHIAYAMSCALAGHIGCGCGLVTSVEILTEAARFGVLWLPDTTEEDSKHLFPIPLQICYDMIWYYMVWYDMIWYDIYIYVWNNMYTHIWCIYN